MVEVSFYRQWESFPHARTEDDQIMVSVQPNPEGEGGNYEFAIVGVGSGPGRHRYIGARVASFDDSWRAFTDLPEQFAALAAKDTSAPPDDWRTPRPPVSLDEVAAVLTGLGYRDRTSEFAGNHEHVFTCACGLRGVAARKAR